MTIESYRLSLRKLLKLCWRRSKEFRMMLGDWRGSSLEDTQIQGLFEALKVLEMPD